MAQARMSMRKIKEVLRLKWSCGLSNRAIGRSCRVSSSTVSEYVQRAKRAGLSWPLPDDLDEATLWERLFPVPVRPPEACIPMPDWPVVHKELKGKGVTRQLLWREYRAAHENGFSYSQFCEHYRTWRQLLKPTMRQRHEPGEAMVDYTGLTMGVMDPATGEKRKAEIFVFSLAVSRYIYAEAHWSQDLPSWIRGHEHAHRAVGGVPPLTIIDNLRSGVSRACRYDPDLNPTFHAFAVHCGTAVMPTRVAAPRDKANAENAVLIVERDVLAPLRNVDFFGLAALNAAIAERLAIVNHRQMAHIGQNRLALLEELDRPALLPLPIRSFEVSDWKLVKVPLDYHVEFDHHFYSVPYTLIGQTVEIRATADVVELLAGGTRVASHPRSHRRGDHTTDPAHMPESHRAHAEWTPERIAAEAERIGPHTAAMVAAILEGPGHPRKSARACLGIVRLARRHAPEHVDEACRYAKTVGALRFKSVQHILLAGLVLPPEGDTNEPLPTHANVRGAAYYR